MADAELVYARRCRLATETNVKKELKKGRLLMSQKPPDPLKLAVCVAKLKDYREKLSQLCKTIIASIDDEGDSEIEMQKAADFDDELLETVSLFTAFLDDLRLASASQRPSNALDVSNSSQGAEKRCKLPKLCIKKYSGNPMAFQEFWDSFSGAVHENNDLSDIERFQYLRSFLEGEALSLVEGYRLTAANYIEVVEALKERFGNVQLSVFAHFEALLSLQAAGAETKQLRATFDSCERHIRSLVALGLHEETFGQVFCPIILSKLPWSVRMELNRKNGPTPWELATLRQLLKDELVVREMSQAVFSSNSNYDSKQTKVKPQHGDKKWSGLKGTASSLLPATAAAKKGSGIKCAYCSLAHHADECTSYPDVASRRAQLGDRCLCCLGTGHMVKSCKRKRECAHCGRNNHHRSLCHKKFGTSTVAAAMTSDANPLSNLSIAAPSFQPSPQTSSSLIASSQRAVMQTAQAQIVSTDGKNRRQARLLLDTGSSRSFITQSVSSALKLQPKQHEIISVAGFGDKERRSIRHPVVEFMIIARDSAMIPITANVTSNITCPIERFPLDPAYLSMLQDIVMADTVPDRSEMVDIDILIGCDYYHDIVLGNRMECPGGLILLNSRLGFVAAGRMGDSTESQNKNVMLITHQRSDNYDLERFWRVEELGIKDKAVPEDEDVLKAFTDSITVKDGRYCVRWPWKANADLLPDNYHLALGRLKSSLRRLQSDDQLLEKYNAIISDQLQKGIIEVAPANPSGRLHYIPHHAVITPGKATTKIRIVYDASAKARTNAINLNECLSRGPVLLSDLCGLLIRFRLHRFGLVSDVEKAFLQIGLDEDDRDATRFFWLKDPSKQPTQENLIIYRFCRIPFGFKPCSFFLDAVMSHHLKTVGSPVALQMDADHYADNVVTGASSSDTCIAFYDEAKGIFRSAAMNLREWFSNCPELLAHIPQEDRGATVATKVLGMIWNTADDSLKCDGSKLQKPSSVMTKRQCLKFIASLFDPCGILSPISIQGKALLQQLWKNGCPWDEPLVGDLLTEWQAFSDSLCRAEEFQIPRWILPGKAADCQVQLHCFCDASAKAYAAAVYLRATIGRVTSVNLIFSKSKVSPIKPAHTIPRLELMAMVIGSRILAFVEKEIGLPVVRKVLWSDSQCVLHWVSKNRVQTVFVRNRVNEIRSQNSVEYRYVGTEENPADLPSRGVDFDRLANSQLWWTGPNWLAREVNHWPIWELSETPIAESADPLATDNAILLANQTVTNNPEYLVDPMRFSSLDKLLRVTCIVFRFVQRMRKTRLVLSNGITAEEMRSATTFWVKHVQTVALPRDVFRKLKLSGLDLFLDSAGILRCKGRLDNAEVPEAAKYPQLLPKDNPFTDLVIRHYHTAMSHVGVSHTLSQLRHEYWILRGRSQVKKVLIRCQLCRKISGGAFKAPDPPALPDFRVRQAEPFRCVGLDYFGPLLIRGDSPDQSYKKVWICLYTCASTRAVHLEVVELMSAPYFLLAFRRFVAIYGCPTMIISDNAKQFHAANRTLLKVWVDVKHDPSTLSYMASKRITWKFIPEFAPWMGGFYERLVGLTKSCLKKSLDKKCVGLVELQTLVAEAARVLNSRPLVYVDDECGETALTPSHFLSRNPLVLPSSTVSEDPDFLPQEVRGNDLILSWRRSQAILDTFWKAWVNQYLLSLRDRQNSRRQHGVSDLAPELGTVVLIKMQNMPRGSWLLGRIVQRHLSRDQLCRSVTVKCADGKERRRPIKLLFPLESAPDAGASLQRAKTQEAKRSRPVRAAAKMAEDRICNQARDEAASESD